MYWPFERSTDEVYYVLGAHCYRESAQNFQWYILLTDKQLQIIQ